MTHSIKERTLELAKSIAANRTNAKGRRAAIGMTTDDAIAICAALSDLWEVASTGEALAAEVLPVLKQMDATAEQIRMRTHAHNILEEMNALAGEKPDGSA